MNKLSIPLLSLLITLYVCAGSVHAQNATQHTRTEIAVVDVFFGTNKICITHPDEKTETININATGKGDEPIFSQHRAIRSVLQKFYDEGWVIESELVVPMGVRAVYVLKREVR